MPRQVLSGVFLAIALVWTGASAMAARYAAIVMDMRNGQVLYSKNADERLYPASLTKMMTLYIAFEAIRNGEITLDTKVSISRNAASEPPSRLGLHAGQKVALRQLIRAAAIKSANDAATAIGEAIAGSEQAFARRMNRTARALGMTRTTFRNANGLTLAGHLSTARDMAILGRALFFHFPQYYGLFSRRSAVAAGKTIRNTNRKFLAAYRGADGIKTGYTQAAGFNLVASARRGGKRIIAAEFGGRSVSQRNSRMARLLDLGFRRAAASVRVVPPPLPVYGPRKPVLVASAVSKSPRPMARPSTRAVESAGMKLAVSAAVSRAAATAAAPLPVPGSDAPTAPLRRIARAAVPTPAPVLGPVSEPVSEPVSGLRPAPRDRMQGDDGQRVVMRMSTSGGRGWGIRIGVYPTRVDAEKVLLRTALEDLSSLDGALRKVVLRKGRYQAQFVGLTEGRAKRACSRLRVWRQNCEILGPTG